MRHFQQLKSWEAQEKTAYHRKVNRRYTKRGRKRKNGNNKINNDEGKPSLTKYHIYWSTLLRDKKTANEWSVRPRRATIEMALVTIWWPSMTIKQSAINDNQAIRQHQKSPVVMNHLPEAAPSGGLTGTLLESCYTTLHCTSIQCAAILTALTTVQCTATVHSLQCTTQRCRKVHNSEAKYCLLLFFALQGKVEFAPHWSSKQFNYRDRTGSEN